MSVKTTKTTKTTQHQPCGCGHPVIDHAAEYGGCRRAAGLAKCACKSVRPIVKAAQSATQDA